MYDGYRALYMRQISSFPSESQWSSRSITKSRMEYLVLHFLKNLKMNGNLAEVCPEKIFRVDLRLMICIWFFDFEDQSLQIF